MRPIQGKDPYSFERKLADTNRKRSENLANFRSAGGSLASDQGGTKLPSTNYIEAQEKGGASGSNSVQGSFNRMMNIGQVGGLGGRMGELEKASMRLGEAASQRRISEMEKEQQVKTAGIGQTARASEKADLESRLRQLQSRRPNLLFNQEGQDWQNEIKKLEDQIRSLGQ